MPYKHHLSGVSENTVRGYCPLYSCQLPGDFDRIRRLEVAIALHCLLKDRLKGWSCSGNVLEAFRAGLHSGCHTTLPVFKLVTLCRCLHEHPILTDVPGRTYASYMISRNIISMEYGINVSLLRGVTQFSLETVITPLDHRLQQLVVCVWSFSITRGRHDLR